MANSDKSNSRPSASRRAGSRRDDHPSGLLVDFGGVLTTSVWDSFRAFCAAEGIDLDAVRRLFRTDQGALGLLRRLESGEISEFEFEPQFGALLGLVSNRHPGLIDRLFAGMKPEQAMIDAVLRARRAGLRTGLVSNSWGHGRYDRSKLGELFDGIVISGEVGLYKPQPEIYRLGAERVRLEPDECVFVDDLRENVEGAEAVGMRAVLHRSADDTLEQLEGLLDTPLR
jgi:epoxide hydrolase-like predicted phosphatase